MIIQLTLTMIDGGGTWRVAAPNNHYRECSTARLSGTVEQVVADYAEWLKTTTNLDHVRAEKCRSI